MKKQAFTLIELLLVIAIIGILASILLPSLQGARDMSKVAVCASNARQMAMGTFMAADNFNSTVGPSGYHPDHTSVDTKAAITVGDRKVGWVGNALISMNLITATDSQADYKVQVQDKNRLKGIMCPSDTNETPTFDVQYLGARDANGPHSPADVLTSYAPNHNVFRIQKSSISLAGKFELLDSPQSTMMLMDSGNIDNWNTRYIYTGNANYSLLQRYSEISTGAWGKIFATDRHIGDRIPIALFDGHIEQVKKNSTGQMSKIWLTTNF